jgi:hypothetical protein
MTDYFSPTVIQPSIPLADMTPLERLVLGAIFDADPDGDALYFHSGLGPSDTIRLSTIELRAALDASTGTDSTAFARVAERLGGAEADADDGEIEIDLGGASWAFIFQDIVRRSPTLAHVTAVTSFTCSKMRPDGFGGMAVLITADAVIGKSTGDIIHDLLDQTEPGGIRGHGAVGTAPGFGAHVLLRLREQDVRAEIAQAIATDETLTTLAAAAISDADIRAGCLAVVERTNLDHERGAAVFQAALAAIREAEHRKAAAV